ncbi:MAG: NFACT RNA binding domain-containing protein [Candidatus Marinimicrobia bacterium]|nr:NFACT RNA binding domain-containing protein [Candidatus Neomarinimicrobiota bacterium]MCF7839174.1 NFACT RNA binding domain-containing protein [Candidatus Neomarinimicrobiota bacterium]
MLDSWMTLWHWTAWLQKNLPGYVLTEIFTYQKQRLDLWFERGDSTRQLAWLPYKNQFTFYVPRTPSLPRRRVEIFKSELPGNLAVRKVALHTELPIVLLKVENQQSLVFDFRHPKGNVYLRQNDTIHAQFLKAVPWRQVEEKWLDVASLRHQVLTGKLNPIRHQKSGEPIDSATFDSLDWLAAHYQLAGVDRSKSDIPDVVSQILHESRQSAPASGADTIRKRGKTVLTRWRRKLKKQMAEMEGIDTTRLQNQADGLAIAIASEITSDDSDHIRLPAHLSPTGEELVIPLNRKLKLQENLTALYQQVRKLKSRMENHEKRVEKTRSEIDTLDTLLQSADESALKQLLEQHGERFSKESSSQPERVPYRKFTSPSGLPILVGRGARDNDILTFKLASKFDWWFHARGVTGSHVILQTGKQTPQHRDLVMAAQLAVRFSDAKHAGVAPVSYCQRKYLSKPKGGAPGAVKFFQEEVLTVEPYEFSKD